VNNDLFSNDAPLKGVRVLELATVLAGPMAGSFWAALGADVIKVERPETGDVTRSWRVKGEGTNQSSAYYASANSGKRVVRCDLASVEGRKWLEGELALSDVVVQNFRTKSAAHMKLDPEHWCGRHPRLIHVHLKGFAHEPGRSAYDVVVQAEAGFMAMNGEPDGGPLRMPVAFMDVLAAHQMQSAVLAALYAREKSDRGASIEVWLDAAGLTGLVNRASAHWMTGQPQGRTGSAHPQIAPYGDVFKTRDGAVVTAVGNDAQFSALCQSIGAPQDPRFASNPRRVNLRQELLDFLAPYFLQQSTSDLLVRAKESHIPLGEIRSVAQALESPLGRSMLLEEMQDGAPTKRVRPTAFRIQSSGRSST